jgi:8-oxo-dGTP diphosphatase
MWSRIKGLFRPQRVVKAGTAVILYKGNRVLIGQRMGSHGEGLWAFPGGNIDPTDSSLKNAGEREVYEETNIICDVYKPDGFRDDLFTTLDILSEDGTKIYVTVYLLAKYVGGGESTSPFTIKPVESHKCMIWRWVTLEELAEFVNSERGKSWIPLEKVVHYMRDLLRVQS